MHDVLFNRSKSKLLVYNKKDADPHFEINGADVSTCEKLHIWDMYWAQPISMKWCLMVPRNLIVV